MDSNEHSSNTNNTCEIGVDREIYGALMRVERLRAGYRTAKSFREAIIQKTGLAIATDTLYRMETGKALPSLEQMIAVNLTLWGVAFPEEHRKLTESSLSQAWKGMHLDGEVNRICERASGRMTREIIEPF